MKKICRPILLPLLVIGIVHGAGDISSLWNKSEKSSSKPHISNLWDKKRTGRSKKISSTTEKIENSKNILHDTSSHQKQMDQQLSKLAGAIQRTTLESIAINRALSRLEKELRSSETQYQAAQSSIAKYGTDIKRLNKTIDVRHRSYSKLLSDQFALVVAMKTTGTPSVNSIIQHEAYEALKRYNNHVLSTLKIKIDDNRLTKRKMLKRQNSIKQSISALKSKRELYKKKQKKQKELLVSLEKKEDDYQAQLKAIIQRQETMRQTLAKLSIIRQKEIAEAKRAEQAKRMELKRKIAERKKRQSDRLRAKRDVQENNNNNSLTDIASANAASNIKRYGSSYEANNIFAYRGAKTISPLARAKVVKKFGSYVDPIYKMKIFNHNVVLKSPSKDAKVRNVLNGKVVYIGENGMLGKVIIIEHGRRLHTIYSSLSKISPLLHIGSRVKKGIIIGRVKRKLVFQATQDSKYINPLRLISI